MNRRQMLSTVSALMLAAGLPATVFAQDAPPTQGGTLNVGFISDLRTMDPLQSTQWTERQILFTIFDRLVDLNPDFSLKPGLAKSWDFEEDGRRLVLHLETGVTFHDGTSFNAEAVKWNLDTRLDPNGNSSQRRQLEGVIESVEVVDDATVAITLTEPYPPLLSLFADRAGLMASPAAAEKWGEDIGSHPVGTGPFKLGEWTRGSTLTVTRNEEFWQEGMPHLDAITFNDIPSNVVGIQRMMIGELDYIGHLTPLDTKLAAASPEISVEPSAGGQWYSLQWKWDSAPYDNPELRRAVAYGLNRERINQILWEGEGVISNGFTPDGLWWSTDDLADYSYDPDKARQILEDAGLTGTKLQLAAPSGDALRRFAELAHEDLNAIGLDVELAPVPQSEYYAKTVAGEIRFTPMRWTQRADPDGLIQYLFATDGTANSTKYSNPQVDEWIYEARVLTDQDARKALYDKIQKQISEDLAYMPVGFSREFSALRAEVKGYTPMPDLIPRFRYFWKDGA
ncbi:ABC transporter substrate-binding protein [Oceanicella sp. SM1341]|uniref:ABC transporter substrate-binding protein n=1 Tax=Oceanicella sp. SM1341 TaxID=1548889 RepID=UPI00130016CE|nr:ABC transporter substrate-binding protein [Oceanicella sp. SM1341]